MRVEKTISLDHRFHFPAVIDYVHYGGKVIAVAREEGNWIVLDNQSQLDFFKALGNMPLKEALVKTESKEDANWVVTQLVARHFEEPARHQELTPVMQLYLTNSCNMRCPHCYMSAGKAKENELTTCEVHAILDAYKQNGGVDVKLTGGEIALRTDLLEIVKHGADIGLHMELLTNGTLWTKEAIREIVPYISVVQISIDGYNDEENAKVRGKGNFQKALDAVDTFAKVGAKVEIAMTAFYTPKLSTHINDYVAFVNNMENKYKDFDLKVHVATGLLPGRYGSLTENESEDYTSITQAIYSRSHGCNDFVDEAFIKRHRSGVILDNCSYGYPSIASNGDVFMCPLVSNLKSIANIRTTPLDEIMSICNYAHKLSDTSNLEPCNNCELKYICGGDCRINYFKDFTRGDIKNVKAPVRRICTQETKEKFYQMMLEMNKDIFH